MKYSKYIFSRIFLLLASVCLLTLGSCDDNKSYSEMLTEEEHAVNWYLAKHQVETKFPAEDFKYGEDAPYYRMNADGSVYMKVLDPGNMEDRPEKGQTVYFRFMRMNIKNYYDFGTESWVGNADNMDSSLNATSLIYGNTSLSSTTQYGTGLQVPLDYLGYNCHVMLIVKSIEGMSGDISNCIPYVYDIRYFKAEY